MKFAPIVPIPELANLSTKGDLHLLLAHLRSNKSYMNFYKSRRTAGDYLIADNSAYELGKSINWPTVIRFAEDVNAQEIVLPDVMRDSVGTFERTSLALKTVPQRFRVMIVPQGEDKRAWEWCLARCLQTHSELGSAQPAVIGVSKIYEKWQRGRYELLSYLEHFYVKDGIDVHLLGFTSPLQVQNFRRDFSWVRSIDSAKPIVAALSNIDLKSQREFRLNDIKLPARPENYFSLKLADDVREIAKSNIQMVHDIADGILTIY